MNQPFFGSIWLITKTSDTINLRIHYNINDFSQCHWSPFTNWNNFNKSLEEKRGKNCVMSDGVMHNGSGSRGKLIQLCGENIAFQSNRRSISEGGELAYLARRIHYWLIETQTSLISVLNLKVNVLKLISCLIVRPFGPVKSLFAHALVMK